jgi:hypothetical protein
MPEKTPEELQADAELKKHFDKLFSEMGATVDKVLEPEASKADASASAKVLTEEEKAAAAKAAQATETPEQKEAREKAEREAAEAKAKADKEAADRAQANLRPVIVQKREEKPVQKTQAELDAEAAAKADADYIATLTLEQQEEIELARYAEAKGKKGAVASVLDYARKIDKFGEEHPDTDVESDEWKEFVKKNDPQWASPAEKRKFEREMIREQAVAEATKAATEKMQEQINPATHELAEMRTAPIVNQILEATEKKMADGGIAADVAKKIVSMPYDQALAEYRVEAPIVVSALAAAKEWTRLWNGVVQLDDKAPLHNWLLRFKDVATGKIMAKSPAEQLRDGRSFMPINQFIELSQKNPAEAAKYYTIDHQVMAEMIADNAVENYKKEVANLEKSGFVRKPAEKKEETPKQAEVATTTTTSPKATGHTMGGVGATATENKVVLPEFMGLAKLMDEIPK